MSLSGTQHQRAEFDSRSSALLSEQSSPPVAGESAIPTVFQLDRLYLFSFAWAVASLLHCLSFGERLNLQHPFCLGLVVAASLVIMFPQSVWLFLAMICFSMCNTLDWMPSVPNHILFEFVANIGILSVLGWTLIRQYSQGLGTAALAAPATRAAMFDLFAPFVRVSLIIMYFYSVLHKLNTDYFNPDISCSTILLRGITNRLPSLTNSAFMGWAAIWGTLVFEALIPICLCFRRTRWAGILLGVSFHSLLSLHLGQGIYSFSGLLFALYLLFVPVQFPTTVQLYAQRLLGNSAQRLAFALRALVCLGVLGLIVSGRSAHALFLIGLALLLIWGLIHITTYLLVFRNPANEPERSADLFRIRPAVFWLIPALIFFNGMNPYLGLKTSTSFAMFSNLRTEGGISNHLLIKKPLYLTNLQNDLVDIKETNLDKLKVPITNQQLITYFEFRSIISKAKTNFYATYVRNGTLQTVRVVNGVSNQPELIKPYPWLVAKFVRLRLVDKGPCTCKH